MKIKVWEITDGNHKWYLLYDKKNDYQKRCNECLECHHFSNGCDGNSEPCEAFEYAKW